MDMPYPMGYSVPHVFYFCWALINKPVGILTCSQTRWQDIDALIEYACVGTPANINVVLDAIPWYAM